MNEDFAKFSEVRLWRNVLYQAYLDATKMVRYRGQKNMVKASKLRNNDRYFHNKRELERRQAINWFDTKNPDFRFVCTCAGLDPNAVADNFERYYK